jgi:hypothetical protein
LEGRIRNCDAARSRRGGLTGLRKRRYDALVARDDNASGWIWDFLIDVTSGDQSSIVKSVA